MLLVSKSSVDAVDGYHITIQGSGDPREQDTQQYFVEKI